jgi:hypothetical protein
VSHGARDVDFRDEQHVAHCATRRPLISQYRLRCRRPATGLRCQRSIRSKSDNEALQQARSNRPNGEKTNISASGCAGSGGRKILVSPLLHHAEQGLQLATAMVVNLHSAPTLPQHRHSLCHLHHLLSQSSTKHIRHAAIWHAGISLTINSERIRGLKQH